MEPGVQSAFSIYWPAPPQHIAAHRPLDVKVWTANTYSTVFLCYDQLSLHGYPGLLGATSQTPSWASLPSAVWEATHGRAFRHPGVPSLPRNCHACAIPGSCLRGALSPDACFPDGLMVGPSGGGVSSDILSEGPFPADRSEVAHTPESLRHCPVLFCLQHWRIFYVWDSLCLPVPLLTDLPLHQAGGLLSGSGSIPRARKAPGTGKRLNRSLWYE